jgi:hypothetical protein
MTHNMTHSTTPPSSPARATTVLQAIARDIAGGIIAVTHNTLALVGFAVILCAVLVLGRGENRNQFESQALGWLQARQVLAAEPIDLLAEHTPGLVLDVSLQELPPEQKRVADWLSKRYRIAPDPMAHMVQAAFETSKTLKLDPHLVLAVAAIESSFNPFVQSGVGAQGLMQVMSSVHEEKFERFGGTSAAFDPVTSIKVGAVILREYVTRAGSLEGGLKMYVGATSFETEGGYGQRVLQERVRIAEVATGKRVPLIASVTPATPATPAAQSPAAKAAESAAVTIKPAKVDAGELKAPEIATQI